MNSSGTRSGAISPSASETALPTRTVGFFDTSSDAERLIKRPKSQADNPLPSGNGLGAEATLMLAGYTVDDDLYRMGLEALRSAGLLMDRYPSMVGHHLSILFSSSRMRELAVVGPAWAELSLPYWERFRPEIVVAASPTGDEPIPLFTDRASNGDTLAHLCERTCATFRPAIPPC